MNSGPPQATPGRIRARAVVWIVAAAMLAAVVVLGACWGTRRTLPPAITESAPGSYEFVAFWNGAGLPGGAFDRPMGVAVAPGGDLYVTDARARVVQLDARGRFVREWGHDGDGAGEFSSPTGVAVAPDGSVHVADFDLDRVQKFTAGGRFVLAFGRPGDGDGELNGPTGLAVDRAGSVYVADFYHHRIQKFSADGSFQGAIGHPGRLGDGALHYPTGLAAAPDGELLVADAYNYELERFGPDGRPLGRLGRHWLWLWPRPAAANRGFNVPTGVAVGRDGLIHIADSGNHRVVLLSVRGAFVAEWKIPDANPAVYSPEQIAVSPDGRTVYATDYAANRIIVLKCKP